MRLCALALTLAQTFEPRAVVDSICANSYRPSVELLADIADLMGAPNPDASSAPSIAAAVVGSVS